MFDVMPFVARIISSTANVGNWGAGAAWAGGAPAQHSSIFLKLIELNLLSWDQV